MPATRPTTTADNRVAIVTGSASGIGQAIKDRLARDGWNVLGVDLRDAEFVADLVDPLANRAAIEEALGRFGRIDMIVAGAGVQHVSPVETFPLERWQSMLALMLTSPFMLAQAGWPALRQCGSGRFIAIASAHSLVASPYKSAYVSAKHGVLGLVKTLALEGADDGISACAVCPGYVRTPLVERQISDQAQAHGIPEHEVIERVILAPQAVKRLIEPSEVADVVAFLASDSGRSFTGTALSMDQGWTAR